MMAAGLITELYSSYYSSMIGWSWIQPRPQRIFSLLEEDEKKTLEHFKHMIKICLNRGHIFQKKLRNTWVTLLKISALPRHLVRPFSV